MSLQPPKEKIPETPQTKRELRISRRMKNDRRTARKPTPRNEDWPGGSGTGTDSVASGWTDTCISEHHLPDPTIIYYRIVLREHGIFFDRTSVSILPGYQSPPFPIWRITVILLDPVVRS